MQQVLIPVLTSPYAIPFLQKLHIRVIFISVQKCKIRRIGLNEKRENKCFSLHLITFITCDDSGKPVPLTTLNKTFFENGNIDAINSMLRKIKELKEINQRLPDLKIKAKLLDEKGVLVSVYDDE